MLTIPKSLVSRIAPTPSGYLHIGNAISFLVTWALVRATGGQLWLRIDDLDRSRFRLNYLEDIFQTLDWLGIDYDYGPHGPDDFVRNFSQHHRLAVYQNALTKLWDQGDLYACSLSRTEIRAQSTDGRYPGSSRDLKLPFDTPEANWRLRILEDTSVHLLSWERQRKVLVHPALTVGDPIVRRKDGLPAYQIASVLDDVHHGVNFIVRGQDLWGASGIQLYLAEQLDLRSFSETLFWHHQLVMGSDGNKLSKSAGAAAIRTWREADKSPISLYQQAAEWFGGYEKQINSLQDLICIAKESLERKA